MVPKTAARWNQSRADDSCLACRLLPWRRKCPPPLPPPLPDEKWLGNGIEITFLSLYSTVKGGGGYRPSLRNYIMKAYVKKKVFSIKKCCDAGIFPQGTGQKTTLHKCKVSRWTPSSFLFFRSKYCLDNVYFKPDGSFGW